MQSGTDSWDRPLSSTELNWVKNLIRTRWGLGRLGQLEVRYISRGVIYANRHANDGRSEEIWIRKATGQSWTRKPAWVEDADGNRRTIPVKTENAVKSENEPKAKRRRVRFGWQG